MASKKAKFILTWIKIYKNECIFLRWEWGTQLWELRLRGGTDENIGSAQPSTTQGSGTLYFEPSSSLGKS
jgi:hypothetical protein